MAHEANNPAGVPLLAIRAGGLQCHFMGQPMVRAKVGDDHDKLLAWSGTSSGALARLEPTLDRRAVCGRSACTVRREGQVQFLVLSLFKANAMAQIPANSQSVYLRSLN